jgi:hypothetical protein
MTSSKQQLRVGGADMISNAMRAPATVAAGALISCGGGGI